MTSVHECSLQSPGWGAVALPLGTDWNWLTVYIVAPIVGALLGGVLYEQVLRPAHPVRS